MERVEYKNEQSSQGRFPANLILSHKPGCKQVGTKEGKGYTINRFTDGAKPFGNGAGHPYEVEDQGPETIAVWGCEDDCPIQEVNKQSGIIKGVVRKPTGKAVYPTEGNSVEWNANNVKDTTVRGFDDTGGAARFFKQVEPENKGRFPANLVLSHKPDCKQVGTKKVKSANSGNKVIDDEAATRVSYAGFKKRSVVAHTDADGTETVEDWDCDDDCAVKQLDEQSLFGGMHSAGKKRKNGEAKQTGEGGLLGMGNHEGNGVRFGDEGGASRFFYCAKASKKEKTLNKTIENKHPTVKSLKLMKYLINLVTPPGGVVLDPFMGSGTTGQAALEGNFGFVGIELEADSFEICKNRCSIDNIIVSSKIELDD